MTGASTTFGVAKALGQVHTTREGQIRGKLAYMSPEQVLGKTVDSRTDVFAASVVLWEGLTGKRLFKAESDAALIHLVLHGTIEPPSKYSPDLARGIDALVMRGLEREASRRFASADEMAAALSDLLPAAPTRKLGAWVKEVGGRKLESRAELVREIEKRSVSISVPGRERDETSPPSLAASRVRDELPPPSRSAPAPTPLPTDASPRSQSATRIAEDAKEISAPSAGGSGSRGAASQSSPSAGSASSASVRDGSQGSSVGIVAQSLVPEAPPARRLGPAILGATVGVALVIAAAVAIRSKSAPRASTESSFVAVASPPPVASSAPLPLASSSPHDPSPWIAASAAPGSSVPVATATPPTVASTRPPPSPPASPVAAIPAARKVTGQSSPPTTKPAAKPPVAAPSAPIFSRY